MVDSLTVTYWYWQTLVSENSPFEHFLVWADCLSAAILRERYAEILGKEPLDIFYGEPVDAPVEEAVHILVKVPEDPPQ